MPRVEIPLIGPSYTNREKPLSAQVTKNMWPEINPEARNQVALHNTAGLKVFATLEGKDRGMHEFNNLLYAIAGTHLYSIDADGQHAELGTIAGTDRCVMANDSTQLIITTGDTPYRYTYENGVEEITDPDLVKPLSVAYLNSQFIFDQNAGVWGEFVTSSIEPGLSIDALDFAQAEGHPDDITRVLAFRQLVYFYGSHSIEPWQNTGQGNPPFARLRGGVQPYGLAGTHGVVATSEYMYFLDNKRIPRRSNGLHFVNIGTPALGVEFATYSKIDDVIAFAFTQDHQQFFALSFPTANRTWVFHEATGSWFQLTNGIGNDRHRATSMMHIYGLNYCADHSNGLLYEYSLDVYSDNGEPIIKQRDTAAMHGGLLGVPGKKLFFDEVEFIIVAGEAEVEGTGPGPTPIIPEIEGICGTTQDLIRGQLLNVSPIQMVTQSTHAISETAPFTNGTSFTDTKVFSFTAAFRRSVEPLSGEKAHLMEIIDAASNVMLEIYMDDSGYIQINGNNAAVSTILDVEIRNAGASFADSGLHMLALVIDLENDEFREIYLNAMNVTNSAAYVTWNTYIDDTLQIAATDATGGNKNYSFGMAKLPTATSWGVVDSETTGVDGCGMVSFDDTCNLISGSVWDSQGYVTDPQAWQGWYKTQPQVFYFNFWRNSGKTQPSVYGENLMEKGYAQQLASAVDYYIVPTALTEQTESALINLGVGGITEAIYGAILPPQPPPPSTELVAPFWENEGTWIDLSQLTNTTFEGMFGVPIELADFNDVFAVDKAALVNTDDADNNLQIQDSIDATNAALFITDTAGVILDSQIYTGVPSGESVLVPTGSDYFVVITSDTGNAQVKKWDATVIDVGDSIAFEDFFGVPFGWLPVSDATNSIPDEGISIRLEVPNTITPITVQFTTIGLTSISTTRTGSVGTTVGDYTADPTHTWGTGGGITAGINLPGLDIDLIPGGTYFFNVRNNSPSGTNEIRIQIAYVVA